MKNNKGFTLVELLVSVALLALIITGLVIVLIQQQRQFNFTSQGVDIDQTGRTALDFIATEIRNVGARQGKSVAFQFFTGGTDPVILAATGFCTDNTSKFGQDSPPDCLTLFTWDITDGMTVDSTGTTFNSTAESVDATIVNSVLSINVANWFPPVTDSALIESGDLIGFWSRGSLCNAVDPATCLNNPESCTECAAIIKIESLNTVTKRATVSNLSSILAQNFHLELTDFSNISDFTSNYLNAKISKLASEMTIVQAKTFAVRSDKALVIQGNGAGNFEAIAGGEIAGDQIGAGIVDLQFVFNLQDADGGITRVGMADDEDERQFTDFTIVSSDTSLSFNGDMRGREKDTRTVEIYLVVRSRLKPQLMSGQRIPVQKLDAMGDVPERDTDHSSLGEGFIYKIFNTVVYLRNLGREEFG